MTDRIYTAAVIIIGNEILSGRTQDTNLRDIATALGGIGIRVAEARVVADAENAIVSAVNELRAKHDYVLTTGGIGSTHDDITAECVAKAFGVKLVEHPTIAALIRNYPAPPNVIEAAMRMALVPEGAELVENTAGGPPGFHMENVYVLAGIPRIMRAMLASLTAKLRGGAVLQSISVTAYTSEPAIAEPLRALQSKYADVDIGSYPFFKDGRIGVTLVARGTDMNRLNEVRAGITVLLTEAGAQPEPAN